MQHSLDPRAFASLSGDIEGASAETVVSPAVDLCDTLDHSSLHPGVKVTVQGLLDELLHLQAPAERRLCSRSAMPPTPAMSVG